MLLDLIVDLRAPKDIINYAVCNEIYNLGLDIFEVSQQKNYF